MPSARLWIVATPIGNPDDLSPRARDILENADLILAEDTRRAGLLLSKLGIKHQRILSFFEHNEAERQKEVLDALREDNNVALITDAGTPLMADPGYRLVRECRKQNICVSPVPGPSAPIAALSAAGLPPLPFTFLGFLPKTEKERQATFKTFAAIPGSLIFFERKNRLLASLKIAHQILGEREVAICRELTKTHEEFILLNLANAADFPADLLGEITVIIGPASKATKMPENEVKRLLFEAFGRGLRPRDVAREVKKQAYGWSVSELYALIQSLKQL